MNFRNLQNMVIECPRCGKELGAKNLSPIDGNSEFLLECSRCSMATTVKFSPNKKESKDKTEFSKDYPLKGQAEPYDVWEEEKLCEE